MKNPIQNKLKEYREKTGLTQIEVAEKLGFNTNNRICRWEKGIAVPSVINLGKLCILYKTKPGELYEHIF